MGVSRNSGLSFTNTVTASETVKVFAQVRAETQDINKRADFFVVQRVNGLFINIDSSGQRWQWDGKIDNLKPFLLNQLLTTGNSFLVQDGNLSVSGDHRFFVGYKVGTEPLRYSPVPVKVIVNP